ncbi:hypothetical protein TCAP_04293 [Tolypocladium capitatum]|uniref:Uncharacterized protein n=1 Tax=Tolypocladium capitatum TaxID=45235 RepID=A0A2K3QDY5_9HYPO|nr:hypothetical protein TCAP_04293 [Tolypocladium capitatum]
MPLSNELYVKPVPLPVASRIPNPRLASTTQRTSETACAREAQTGQEARVLSDRHHGAGSEAHGRSCRTSGLCFALSLLPRRCATCDDDDDGGHSSRRGGAGVGAPAHHHEQGEDRALPGATRGEEQRSTWRESRVKGEGKQGGKRGKARGVGDGGERLRMAAADDITA